MMITVEFTEEEIKNLLTLIDEADIKGRYAMPVVLLQQKLRGALSPEPSENGTEKKVKSAT